MKVKTCRTATDTCSRKPILLFKGKQQKPNQNAYTCQPNKPFSASNQTTTSHLNYIFPLFSPEGKGRNIVLMRIPSVLASWLFSVCILSPEPIGGVWPNLYRHIIGREERSEDFGDIDLIFKVIPALGNFHQKNLSVPYLLKQMTDRILTKIHIYCNVCMDSRFN